MKRDAEREPTEHAVNCGECRAPMTLRRSRFGLFYSCSRWPECKGAHGAHPDGRPLGLPGDSATSAARRGAHEAFDLLWQHGAMTRKQAYHWLAGAMQLTTDDAHFGRFTIEQCEHVVALIAQHFPSSLTAEHARHGRQEASSSGHASGHRRQAGHDDERDNAGSHNAAVDRHVDESHRAVEGRSEYVEADRRRHIDGDV